MFTLVLCNAYLDRAEKVKAVRQRVRSQTGRKALRARKRSIERLGDAGRERTER